jgi:hypothetical protein
MVKVGDTYRVFGQDKKDATLRAYRDHGFSKNVKFHLEEMYRDPPFIIYELTVTEIKPLKEPVPRSYRINSVGRLVKKSDMRQTHAKGSTRTSRR